MLQMVLNRKCKGNTLPEVMIALSLISFCSTLAIVIFLNIQQSTMPFIRIKSNELAQKCLETSIIKKDFFDSEFREEEYQIVKTVTTDETFSDCLNIKITVFDNNHKKLAENQATVYAE